MCHGGVLPFYGGTLSFHGTVTYSLYGGLCCIAVSFEKIATPGFCFTVVSVLQCEIIFSGCL